MTSRPTSKRPTSTPATPVARPPCHIHAAAIIADKAQISGTHAVEVGENTILHPYAKIRSEHGRVVIGKLSMVYETGVVGVADGPDQDVIIGNEVNIETGAVVEAKSVGDGTTIEVNAVVGKGAVIGRHCRIASMERVEANEVLEDFTVVYGQGLRRVDRTIKEHAEVREAKRTGQEKAIELMRKLIPNAAAKWMTSV
jgi:dynactin 6